MADTAQALEAARLWIVGARSDASEKPESQTYIAAGEMLEQIDAALASAPDAARLTEREERIVTLDRRIRERVAAGDYNGVRPLIDAYLAAAGAAREGT